MKAIKIDSQSLLAPFPAQASKNSVRQDSKYVITVIYVSIIEDLLIILVKISFNDFCIFCGLYNAFYAIFTVRLGCISLGVTNTATV